MNVSQSMTSLIALLLLGGGGRQGAVVATAFSSTQLQANQASAISFSLKLILVGQGWIEARLRLVWKDYRNHISKRGTLKHTRII